MTRAAQSRVFVDGNNVMGSRPYGWWHDRAGAARRLIAEIMRRAADHLHRRRQKSRAFEMNVAGTRRGNSCDRSIMRTDAQSCAEFESLRARIPNIAGGELSPAPVLRGDAHGAYHKRFLGAYDSHRLRAGPSSRTSSMKAPAQRTDRSRDAALPTAAASGAGGRRGDLYNRSILRTDAQSRAEFESPRARIPCITGFGVSPATLTRAAALRSKRTRFSAAYVAGQLKTQRLVQRQPPGKYRSDELTAPTATRREPSRPLSCHGWLWSALDKAASLTPIVAR